MKKSVITMGLALVSISSIGCPPSTSHGVFGIGAIYDYNLKDCANRVENIGIGGQLGYEFPNRYVVISGIWGVSNLGKKEIETDRYIREDIRWRLGGEVSVNPIREWGYISPINFDLSLGAGYDSFEKEYISMGLQIRGCMDNYFVPFAKVEFEYMGFGHSGLSSWNIGMSVGMRIWIGKPW